MAPARALLAAAFMFLGGVLLLAALTPLFAAAREGHSVSRAAAISAVVARVAIGPTCHQRAERSLLVGPVRMAACARCTGLYAGGIAAGLLILAGIRVRAETGRAIVLASLVAMAVDVAAGMAWSSWDHPMLRLSTGILLVASVGLAAANVLISVPPPESSQSTLLVGAPR